MAYRRIVPLFFSSLLLASGVHAAELGDPRIGSYRGQPLLADIELSSLDDPATALQVRVANADVYRGASVAVPAALSSLQLNVVKQGGKQFLHVTSSKPVDTDMLLLFLELGQGASRDVRLATLMLATDPHPAPPPVVAVLAPVPPPPAVVVAAPPPVAPKPDLRQELPVHLVAAVAAPLHFAAVSTSLPMSVRPPAPATCKASSANSACAVLDKKNVALQAKLAGLENKIKVLEATLAPAAATPAAALIKPAEAHAEKPAEAHADKPAAPPAPSIIPPIARIKPPPQPVAILVKPKKPKPEAAKPSSTPWLWIGVAGAIGVAALGAIAFLLLRRRKAAPAAPAEPKAPGFMAGVRDRILPGKKDAPGTPVAE